MAERVKSQLWLSVAGFAMLVSMPTVGRAQVCEGQAVETVSHGRQVTFMLDKKACREQVKCPDDTACERLRTEILATGGSREWCGCPGTEEPKECHTAVVHQPPPRNVLPGTKGALDCSATCPQDQTCCEVFVKSVPFQRGDANRFINYYACDCIDNRFLENGACPKVIHPGVE